MTTPGEPGLCRYPRKKTSNISHNALDRVQPQGDQGDASTKASSAPPLRNGEGVPPTPCKPSGKAAGTEQYVQTEQLKQ